MKIKIDNQIFYVKKCQHLFSRFLGMMGRKKKFSYGFYFPNCSSLHTFFMRQNIDIIMTNEHNVIVAFYQDVKPMKIIHCKHAQACYEFSKGILPTITIGSTLTIL